MALTMDRNSMYWIHNKLFEYCDQLGIKRIPIIVFNWDELITCCLNDYNRIMTLHKYKKRIFNSYGQVIYGLTNFPNNPDINTVVLLNLTSLKYYTGLKQGTLEQTLIHELIHVQDKTLRHGKKFEFKIKCAYYENHKNDLFYSNNETNIKPIGYTI